MDYGVLQGYIGDARAVLPVRMCATAGMARLRPRRLARENVCHRGEGAAPSAPSRP